MGIIMHIMRKTCWHLIKTPLFFYCYLISFTFLGTIDIIFHLLLYLSSIYSYGIRKDKTYSPVMLYVPVLEF